MVRQTEKMEWKEDVVKSYYADKNNVSCQITQYDDPQCDAKGHGFIWHGWKLTVTRSLYLVYGTGDPTMVAPITITAERIFKDLDEAKAVAEELSSLLEHRWGTTLE